MRRLKLALFIGALGLLIALLHVVAINLLFYWDIVWFDILMHFLGGFWVALLGLWILAFFTRTDTFTLRAIIVTVLTFTIVIGIMWEVFEASAGISFVGTDQWGDLVTDLIADVLGGIAAGLYASKRYRKLTPVHSDMVE